MKTAEKKFSLVLHACTRFQFLHIFTSSNKTLTELAKIRRQRQQQKQ